MAHHVFERNWRVFSCNMAVAGKSYRGNRTGVNYAPHAAFLGRLDDCSRAFYVGKVHLRRIAHPQPIVSSDVENIFTASHGLLERLRIAQIARGCFSPQFGDIIQTTARTDEQPQVSALRRQGSRNMAADESSRSCNESLHALFFIPSTAKEPYDKSSFSGKAKSSPSLPAVNAKS